MYACFVCGCFVSEYPSTRRSEPDLFSAIIVSLPFDSVELLLLVHLHASSFDACNHERVQHRAREKTVLSRIISDRCGAQTWLHVCILKFHATPNMKPATSCASHHIALSVCVFVCLCVYACLSVCPSVCQDAASVVNHTFSSTWVTSSLAIPAVFFRFCSDVLPCLVFYHNRVSFATSHSSPQLLGVCVFLDECDGGMHT